MTRALYIIPEYPPFSGGGIGTFYSQLLPALARQGVEVTAIVGSALHEAPGPSFSEGVSILPLDQHRARALRGAFTGISLAPDLIRDLSVAWAAWEQSMGGDGFDVVECTDWCLSFVPWLLADTSPPLIVRLHGSQGQIAHHDPLSTSPLQASFSQLIEAALLPRAAMLLTYSRLNQRAWSEQLSRCVEFCPPPLAIEDPGSTSDASSGGSGLVVGRVQNWKGPATLCRALQILGSDAPRVDWIGRSVSYEPLGRSCSAQMAHDFPDSWGVQVIHHPPEPPARIRQRQRSAGFVVVPSDWDVFNFTVAEAMALQAVVICSSGAGAVDLIEHNVTGFSFRAGDPHDLAAVIQEVCALAPAQRLAIGSSARQRIASLLNPDDIARITIGQLEQVRTAPRPALPEHDLLRSALAPVDSNGSSRSAISRSLSRLDLKLLLQHAAERLRRKIWS